MRMIFCFLGLILLLHLSGHSQDVPVKTVNDPGDNFCVSQEEMILFNLVNDLRKQSKLSVIPLSGSLSLVSRIHIENLLTWKPQESGCNLNSWTEGPGWSSCCSNKDPQGIRCMNSKPSEITDYTGKGYELVYWEEESASAIEAFELWKQVQASREMILNKGKWQSKEWKAMGIGIKNGYAVLWMGDKNDKPSNILICGTDSLVQHLATKTQDLKVDDGKVIKKENKAAKALEITTDADNKESHHYFIVVASHKAEEPARQEVSDLKIKGYNDAIVVKSADRFRVSLGSYPTESKAKTRIKELKPSFPDCWLLKL